MEPPRRSPDPNTCLEANGSRIMIDCGLFQGLKELRLLNWSDLPFPAESIQSILLTHAHLDHAGYLPRLVKNGFECPVYSTPATGKLTQLILADSARIQMEDARHANRNGYPKHSPAPPLYDTIATNQTIRQLRIRDLDAWFEPAPGIPAHFHDAGCLLGSSAVEIHVDGEHRLSACSFPAMSGATMLPCISIHRHRQIVTF